MAWRDSVRDAWALLMPVECAGCGSADRAVCPDCRRALLPEPVSRTTGSGLEVVTALRYEGVVRRVILSLKEQGRTDAARALSPALAAAVGLAVGPADIEVTAIPSSRAAYRRRGYDPVALLLRGAGVRAVPVLRSVRATAHQKTLSATERAANLRGAFAARGSLAGRQFLLVDDVLTTGATLEEGRRAIVEAGGAVLGAATLAFTPRWLPFRDIPVNEDYGWAKGAQ
jgi:ComF family protein